MKTGLRWLETKHYFSTYSPPCPRSSR